MVANSFSTVGFTGSRSLAGKQALLCQHLARLAIVSGQSVFVGCAGGADLYARQGVSLAGGQATIFTAQSSKPHHLVKRSASFVQSLAAASVPLLVAFPNTRCHPQLFPSPYQKYTFAGFGSGSWATSAMAVGLGVPLAVFLPSTIQPPAHWGSWSVIQFGRFTGLWQLAPAQQKLI